jgi:hypothetical protein
LSNTGVSLCLDASNKNVKYYVKLILSWICGVEHTDDVDAPTMPPLAPEKTLWRRLCNINGIVILAFCAFLWGFFTDYRIDKMAYSTA